MQELDISLASDRPFPISIFIFFKHVGGYPFVALTAPNRELIPLFASQALSWLRSPPLSKPPPFPLLPRPNGVSRRCAPYGGGQQERGRRGDATEDGRRGERKGKASQAATCLAPFFPPFFQAILLSAAQCLSNEHPPLPRPPPSPRQAGQ